MRPTILHVTESFGGGVATALAQYVLSTPELDHHLLMGERPGDFADSGELALFESVWVLPRNPTAAVGAIRRRIKDLCPNVVHAHSSFAGAYVRIAKRAKNTCPLVYTPHGYSFERKDISGIQKYAFRLFERLLANNTSVTAACSPYELDLARGLNKTRTAVYVPNVAENPVPLIEKHTFANPTNSRLKIAAVGRITAARDPLFFRDTIEILGSQNSDIEAVWIGGGEEHFVKSLEEVGVRVTGWLDRKRALTELSDATLHVHTSAWDAFPMVLLEANNRRIPSLVRPISAFSHISQSLKAASPADMAGKISSLVSDRQKRLEALQRWDSVLEDNNRPNQRVRLREAYGLTEFDRNDAPLKSIEITE